MLMKPLRLLKQILTPNIMAKKVTGFKNVANSISKKQGVSKKVASAELAASTRRSSAAARRKNPNLNRVKG